MIGLLSGMDTLCSLAYGAAKLREMGILTQRALAICTACAIPLVMMWLVGIEPVLRLVVDDPKVVSLAALYLKLMIPSLPPFVLFEAIKRLLQAQSVVLPQLRATIYCILPHTLLCWALVHPAGLGMVGAPLAIGFSYWLILALLFRDLRVNYTTQLAPCWPGWQIQEAIDLQGLLLSQVTLTVYHCVGRCEGVS
jgi:MATE family multidrug resistance protein